MRSALLATSALVAISLSAPAFAQAAGDGDSSIVVTARKREENLIDVPLPVSVATREQLERDQVNSYSDLQRVTPALEISQTSGGEVNGGARLRGLGTGVFNASVSPTVAFVVDQVAQGNVTFPILFDLAQVEVLRGPQGTLFGQGASAGVINISTVAPSLDGISASGGIDLADKGTLGSEVTERVVRAAFNMPLGETVAVRFAGQYKQEKGLQRNTFLGLDNNIKEYALRMRLLWEPSDKVSVLLSAETAKQSFDGWNFFSVATTPSSTAPFDPDGPGPAPVIGTVGQISTGAHLDPAGCNIPRISERAEFYCEDDQAKMRNSSSAFSAIISAEMTDQLTLTSVTALRKLDRETYTVNFSRRLGVAARSENIEGNAEQFSQELRLGYEGEGLDVIAGVYYGDYRTETTPIDNSIGFASPFPGKRTGFSVCLNAGFFCPVPTNFGYELTKNHVFAVFTDATFALADQLDLFGGLRYSTYKNTTGVAVDRLTATNTSKVKDNNISGRIGLSYKPTPDSTIYASYSRGYKPPAIVVPTIATSPVTVLSPEKADAFELGGKIALGRLQLSGNVFYTDIKNFQNQNQTFDAAGSLISVVQNISSIKSKGFELGLFGQVSDKFSINAGYQFNVVKYPSGFLGDDNTVAVPRVLGGTQFLNAPKHKFTLSGEFAQPLSEKLELFVNANLIYKTKVLLAQRAAPQYRYPAHEIVNASIGLRDAGGAWRASLFVRNLTKEREPTAYLAGDFAGNGDGSLRAWPVAGLTARVAGVSLGFDF